jgi:hypothetical protein
MALCRKNGIGIAFWIAGVPGSADIVKVIVPRAIAAGINRLGIPAARNRDCAIGTSTKNATNKLTPPKVTNAPASMTVNIAWRGPNRADMNSAIAATEPLSSISLPNRAPSRNIGKNCATNRDALSIKVCVQ